MFVRAARRFPLPTFVVLAYALSWWPWVWQRFAPDAIESGILSLGPLLAALLVVAAADGKRGLKDFVGRVLHWRVGLGWYAVVLGIPVATTLAAVGVNVLLGAASPLLAQVRWHDAPGQFVVVLLLIGLGEEPAWRGVGLRLLLMGRTPLAASVALWAIHAIWHLPLFGVEYDLQNGVPWLVGLLAYTIIATVVYRHTNGSLLLPALFHAAVNTMAFLFFRVWTGADQLRLWWLWSLLWWAALAGVFLVLRSFGGIPRPVRT